MLNMIMTEGLVKHWMRKWLVLAYPVALLTMTGVTIVGSHFDAERNGFPGTLYNMFESEGEATSLRGALGAFSVAQNGARWC